MIRCAFKDQQIMDNHMSLNADHTNWPAVENSITIIFHTFKGGGGGPTQCTMSYKVSLKVYKMTYLPCKTTHV